MSDSFGNPTPQFGTAEYAKTPEASAASSASNRSVGLITE
jgi:hypothetical protein